MHAPLRRSPHTRGWDYPMKLCCIGMHSKRIVAPSSSSLARTPSSPCPPRGPVYPPASPRCSITSRISSQLEGPALRDGEGREWCDTTQGVQIPGVTRVAALVLPAISVCGKDLESRVSRLQLRGQTSLVAFEHLSSSSRLSTQYEWPPTGFCRRGRRDVRSPGCRGSTHSDVGDF